MTPAQGQPSSNEGAAGTLQYRCALYRSIQYGWLSGFECTDDDGRPVDGYVRVSEVVTCEFPPLADEVVVAEELKNLEAARAEVVEKFSAQLSAIDRRKSELLAVTHQVPA